MSDDVALRLEDVHFEYEGNGYRLGPISLDLPWGQVLAIVGPNGAGKSTLLRIMAGLLDPLGGLVALNNQSIDQLSARRRADQVAFVPQGIRAPVGLTAREIVLLGRYPQRQAFFFETAEDHRVVESVMSLTDTAPFAGRTLSAVSTGEQQRIHLAAAFAQEPRVLILDEPTSALDPHHQLRIFELLRQFVINEKRSVAVATHDLNLANQFSDMVLLLDAGQAVALGTSDEVLRPSVLDPVYRVTFRTIMNEETGRHWIVPTGVSPSKS